MKWMTILAAGCASQVQAGCLDDPAPCLIDGGEYHAILPDTPGETIPVLMFLHGAGGEGARILSNSAMVDAANARGYALIAPTGSRKFGESQGRMWNFFPGWEGRNELAYLKDVVSDAAARFGTDPDQVVLSGFSAGAFMVYYAACEEPDAFLAYAPVSGGFWRPQPDSCAGPVDMFHVHGWTDTVVPLEGRPLGGGRFEQGDIFAGLEVIREANGCAYHDPDSVTVRDGYWHRTWSCDAELELALFPGGHKVPTGWTDMALDWFEALQETPQ